MTWFLTVTDVKQHLYCPRIPYYHRCLPGVRPVTAKMEAGILAQAAEEQREVRRQLRTYGFTTGERQFNVPFCSTSLGVTAVIDLIVLRPDGKNIVIPVDYKLSDTSGEHFKVQLALYGLLLEEEIELPAPFGFLYLMVTREAQRVALTERLRASARASIAMIRDCVEQDRMPEPTPQVGRCVNCEFRRFCNDVA
jgi:CRISPR-associated exonuclease Cas4